MLSVNIPGKQVFIAAPLCCNGLSFYWRFLAAFQSQCGENLIPELNEHKSEISYKTHLHSLGLSINSNVLSLQWNSSENHSIHTVGDFYLDLLVSLVRKQLSLLFIYCIYIQCQAKVLISIKQCPSFPPIVLILLHYRKLRLEGKYICITAGESKFINPPAVYIY